MKWRYKVDVIVKLREDGFSGHDNALIEERLNARAAEGWALVQITDAPIGWLVVYVSQSTIES